MSTRSREDLLALGLLLALVFGLYAGPSALRLSEVCLPRCDMDPSLYVWMFRWMEHAVTTGMNPFVSPLIGGADPTPLYWVTTVSTPAFLAVPLTTLLGARASYNLTVLASIAVSAWAVYLMCREFVESRWAALAGGCLFVLSSYVTFEIVHLNLLFVAPAILFARATIRFTKGLMGLHRFGLVGGSLLLAQFFASTEVFATMTLFGLVAIALFFAYHPEQARVQRGRLLRGLAVAYVAVGLVCLPFLLRAWTLQPSVASARLEMRSVEPVELAVPPTQTLLGVWATSLARVLRIESGVRAGQQGYFGVPVLLLLVYALRHRERVPAMLVPFVAVVILMSFGPVVDLPWGRDVPGPYAPLSVLPLLEHAFPKRFALYAWIGVAILLSLWVEEAHSLDPRRARLWVLIGAVVLLPGPATLAPPEPVAPGAIPQFFSSTQHRWFIGRDDTVLPLGAINDGIEWHVASGLEFRLAEGYLGPYTPWGFSPLRRSSQPPKNAEGMRGLVAGLELDWVAVRTGVPTRWLGVLREVAGPPISVGGIDLYRVDTAGSRPTPLATSPEALAAYRRGVAAASEGLLTEAAGWFRRALAIRPTHRFAHLELAKIYLSYEDLNLAQVHLQAALVENPDFVEPLLELARLWSSTGRGSAADRLLGRVFLKRPWLLTPEEAQRAKLALAGVSP